MITMQCNAATQLIVQSVGAFSRAPQVPELKITGHNHNSRRFLNKILVAIIRLRPETLARTKRV